MFSSTNSKNSNIQTLNNSNSYSPILNIGDDNEADNTSRQSAEQSATAQLKDEMTTTASVGVGVGGDGSGGAVASQKSGDFQPVGSTSASDFIKDNSTAFIVLGGGVVLVGGYMLLKKKKKK